jgi:signal peptidase I
VTTSSAAWRRSRPALVLSTAARALLGTLALLLLASVAPTVAGWETTVVMSGSMEPGVSPGDVAVVRPVDAGDLAVGQVLLVDDPSSPGRLRLHRLVAVEDAGLRLRGDANPTADPQLVPPDAVHGVGVMRLPALGLPVYWAAAGRVLPLAAAAAALALLLALALAHRAPEDEDGPPPPVRPARRVAATGTALGLTALLAALPVVSAADATFTATTASDANSWTAARYFTCTSGGASAPAYLALQESAGPIAYNTGLYAASVSGYYSGSGVTYRVPGPPCDGDGRAVQLDGSTGMVYSTTAVYNPQTFTVQLWFATRTGSGGKLIGFGNGTYGSASTQYDRHVYMTDTGRLAFGVYDNGTYNTVTTSKAYNDGRWHMVSATFSPETGLRLYVDGASAATPAAAPAAEVYTGYWRVGYDTIASSWPGAPTSDHFAGSVGHLSVYTTALTAADIAAQYAARN